jgi:hypothetical protein
MQNEKLPTEQAGIEAFALDLYSRGARFEYRRSYHVSWCSLFSWIPLGKFRLGHNRFLLYNFHFIFIYVGIKRTEGKELFCTYT